MTETFDNNAAEEMALGPIVSSAHLARQSALPQLSEFEFGLIMAGNAFNRWMVRCMSAADEAGLTSLEVLVLHSVTHRDRAKRLADICLVLGIEDVHTVVYAIKKLEARGLVKSVRQGKEKVVSITAKGEEACERYRKVRETLLVKAVGELGFDPGAISSAAGIMRALSGHYDQAARAAASL